MRCQRCHGVMSEEQCCDCERTEVTCVANNDACNGNQAPHMTEVCSRPTAQDPPFLIELGRSIRRAVFGL
jgi:hypothetical protein